MEYERSESLEEQFQRESNQNQPIIDKARECAALSIPWVLPEESHQEQDEFEDNYQSAGSNGVIIFTGKLLSMVFPPGQPWFHLELSPIIAYDPNISDEDKNNLKQALFLRQLAMMAVLESGNKKSKMANRQHRTGFRSKQYMSLQHSVVTGDVLNFLGDDYAIKVFRRDQWTMRRDSSGSVLHYLTREKVHARSIAVKGKDNTAILNEVGLQDLLEEGASYDDLMVDLYTLCEYKHDTGEWLILQELNGTIFHDSMEKVSPFWTTPFNLVSPEHFGRGHVEVNKGELSGLDELEKRLLDMMGAASKFLYAIDSGSAVREDDLAKATGSAIRARVQGGKVQDVGVLTTDLSREFTILATGLERKGRELGKAFLTESEAMPNQDRVTREQIVRIGREIDMATGGILSSLSDNMQLPLLQRLEHQMERDGLMPLMPDGAKEGYEITTVNGIQAMVHGQKGQAVMSLATVAAQLPEAAQRKIDWGVLVDVMARYSQVHEHGMIKSNEQVAADQQAEQQQAIQQQAAAKGVEVVGNVAEQQALAQQ